MRRFSTCSITKVVVRYIFVVLIEAGDTLLLCGCTNLLLQQVSTFKTNDNKTTKTSKSQITSILAVVFHFLVLGMFLDGLVSIPAVWFIPGLYQVALSTHVIIYSPTGGSDRRTGRAMCKGKAKSFRVLKHQ